MDLSNDRTADNQATADWRFVARVLAKAALLFVLLNLLFVAFLPLEALGRLSLYNWLYRGRERLPYGEVPAESYNLSLFNVPVMFASHELQQEKPADGFRVLLFGDSGTWGWFLANQDTLAGQLNEAALQTGDGRDIKVYNLGYPVMSLTKDLMLLQEALDLEPDLIVWPVTLESFPREKQLFSPLVQNNATRVRALIARYNLALDPDDERLVEPEWTQRTIVGARRELADLLRLQLYGFSWAATGIDQAIPDEIPLRKSDFDEDLSWQEHNEPVQLGTSDLALDVLAAGVAMAGDVPVLIVNEPMFISSGENSDLRYNSFYPRWAYDQYRELIAAAAVENGWRYLDLWDAIPPDEFTDTPVHLTPAGTRQLADRIGPAILNIANKQ